METQTDSQNHGQLILNKPIETALTKLKSLNELEKDSLEKSRQQRLLEKRELEKKSREQPLLEKQKKLFTRLLIQDIYENAGVLRSLNFFEQISDEEFIALAEDALERSQASLRWLPLKLFLISLTGLLLFIIVVPFVSDRKKGVLCEGNLLGIKSDLVMMREILEKKGVDTKVLIKRFLEEEREKIKEQNLLPPPQIISNL